MHTTTFTVIITTYNRQHLLPRAIKSVLDQTFPDFELLVIDNGSTDETPSVVRGIRDDRVRYVRNPRPTGSCDGPRNLGIGMAKGRFVAFLDDDDIWYPERLEKVKRAFDEHPDVSCVCHNEMRNVSGTLDRVLRYGPWTADLYERLIYEGNCLSSCATTIKAEAVRQFNGFDEREEYSEVADYDLWIRMAREGVKVFFIEEPLGEFSLTGKNWSVVNPFFEAKQASMVKGHILRHEGVPLLKVSKRGMRKLFQLYFIAGRSFAKAGRFAHAAKWFLTAALFLVRRPSLVFDPRPRQRYV